MSKIWTIPGGIHPAENKQQSLTMPLGEISLPTEMIFPLSQHIGAPANAIVEVGDRVLAGQKIAGAQGFISAPVHASTSGIVTAIEERTLPHPSGMSGLCIILKPDGKDEQAEFVSCEDYLSLPPDLLLAKIREAGITGMGGAGFPTSVKLSPHADRPIDTLIINGTECEPYITADDMLMRTRAEDIVKGTELLAQILNQPERIVIGIEDNKPQAIEAVGAAVANAGSRVEVVSFPTKYPSGGEKQLIQILTGHEVPSGALPSSIGVVLQNVGTTVAAYEAVRYGRPLIERITTVVGDALQVQRNIRVKLGTPISHIMEQHGLDRSKLSRLIMGGPMMGYTLAHDNIPVVKTSNCILAPSQAEMPPSPPAQACIRCGMCAEACPVNLLPQQMYWYALAEDYERLESHNLNDCIECGACSFTCPSSIPLVQYYRAAKGIIRQNAIDKEKSDRSRRRFEFRQERMAKAEAEKEAKRNARKQAAAKGNRQQADKATAKVTPVAKVEKKAEVRASAIAPDDPIAAAIARAQEKASLPADEKLRSSIDSLNKRLSKAEAKLAAAKAEGGDTVDALQMGVDKLKTKIATCEQELAELGSPSLDASTPDTADAAAVAIEKAKARAVLQAGMSPQEKLRDQIAGLEKRLDKATVRLANAEAAKDDNVDAFRAGVEKTQAKLEQSRTELKELEGSN